MIKVIVGYELKEGADIQPALLKLRSYALTFPGFISAEHIRSVKSPSIVALLYNWEKLADWEAWESSKISRQIMKEAEDSLASEPRITAYTLMPTSAWTHAST
ncbi:MAG: antibiotic biosynthesis monooxygenase family protein [Dehalococcoidia bacterium]